MRAFLSQYLGLDVHATVMAVLDLLRKVLEFRVVWSRFEQQDTGARVSKPLVLGYTQVYKSSSFSRFELLYVGLCAKRGDQLDA